MGFVQYFATVERLLRLVRANRRRLIVENRLDFQAFLSAAILVGRTGGSQ
jgi:hypothetical protein